MRTLLNVAVFLFVTVHATAQESRLSFDVKTSFGIYQLKPLQGMKHRYSDARSAAIGADISYRLTPILSVSSGAFYSRISYKTSYDFIVTLQPNDPLVPLKSDVRADYLEVPLLLNIQIHETEKANLYVNGGYVSSFLVSDKDKTTFANGEIRKSGYVNKKHTGLQFGAGLRQRLNKNVGLIVEPQYRFFTSKIDAWMNKNSSAFYLTVGLFLQTRP